MTNISKTLEFPKDIEHIYQKAIRYQWISFFYMISSAIFTFIVMSNSQAMKTVWLQDLLGIIPPFSFLISTRIVRWKATRNFPYGFHRIVNLAYLTSALSLFILGLYLLIDGLTALIKLEHPTITTIFIGDTPIWLGYIMFLALLWSSIPSTILGHIKIPLAKSLYDKILFADSKMNKASWTSGFASIVGLIGIGFGFWWADAVAALLISLSILNDGYSNLKQSLLDLLDEIPKNIGNNKTDPLIAQIKKIVEEESWVKEAKIRVRDEGHVFFGDIFILPKAKDVPTAKIDLLREKLEKFHWRLHDMTIMPVEKL
ncbi:cation efflux family protein [Legionella adelaidensis]|uniref:Cation efflux family protein n=1 Tax=Legionella adelaidensis TaxID=45056 RepID=A0A0W0R6D1_9GAMM|nr:cation transporter [Legionella adelaidensis]KTC66627.1 cation efflux family protein [Legionella adelaidensis]VEH81043.1 cation efflux family protein [Legionella adelaidensis]